MHRLTEFSLRRPWLILSLLSAITVFLAFGIPKITPGYGFQVLIGDDHPAVQRLDDLVEQFGGGVPVRILWECGAGHPCDTVFDPASLNMAESLSQTLAALPWVMNVISPANASILVPSESGFAVRHFVEQGVVAPDAPELANSVLDDPLWLGDLVSEDGQAGVIVLQPANRAPETDVLLSDAIDAALAPFAEQGFSFYAVGGAVEAVGSGRALAESSNAIVPVMIAVIGVLLLLMTRSWQQTLITLITMGVGYLWTMGALGWMRWPQDGMLEVLPIVVVIVGVCDAVHLLSRYAAERNADASLLPQQALLKAARDAGPACVITTLTSAGAFASFVVSSLDTFIRFGFILPFGVIVCLLLTFSLLPIAAHWLPSEKARPQQQSALWRPAMNFVVGASARRTGSLLMASVLLLVFFGFGWAVHLRADTDWVETFGETSRIGRSIHFVTDRMGSSSTLEVDLQLPPGTEVESPEVLARISQISNGLSALEGLGASESVVQLIERLNRLLHGDRPEYETVGLSSAANAEMLELIEFDDPETVARWMSLDRSRLRISVATGNLSQARREVLLAQVEEQMAHWLPEGWQATLTGETAVSRDWARDVEATQHRSFPIAFLVVFVLVSVFFRSWKYGLAAMVPTFLPVVIVMGAMGWLGMSLDIARAMIAAVVIGIGVDDSIHLLAHYRRFHHEGLNSHEAMRAALHHTGRALVTTSFALAVGFVTLMMSAWPTVASFGSLVSMAIVGALLATLFVLPALVFAAAPQSAPAQRPLPTLTPAPAAGPDGEE